MSVWSGFKNFILRGNTIDLAVAFVVGAAFNGMIQSLVRDLITPLIAAIGGNPNFSSYYVTLHHSKFLYGDFLNSFISFMIIALAVFFLVVQPINKLISLTNRLRKAPDPTDKKCPECLSTIPAQASRCAFCGVKLTAAKA
jgi:large conductance mechanosensitive channel